MIIGIGGALTYVFKLRADNPGSGLAEVWMKYDFSKFTYPDGTQVELRKPIFQIRSPYDETTPGSSRILAKDVQTSPRMTPPMIGLGLIEAIPKEDILNLAKRDLSAWGIHGKPNWVIDRQKELQKDPVPLSLGRFGLKANTPSVFHQSLGALNGDMGVTNFAFPKESIERIQQLMSQVHRRGIFCCLIQGMRWYVTNQ